VEVLVVGAGYAGAVVAERLARAGKKVLVIDRRSHIGGNAFDELDPAGVLVHRYGPHIFHTRSKEVYDYLSRFTEWRPYEHRVLASVEGKLLPMPINLDTVNRLYGWDLDESGLEAYFERVRERRDPVRTSEDVVVNAVGRDLYEKFFRNYTRKQWNLDPSQLDARVTARIPVRTNRDDRYFTDPYQAMPRDGYTKMFERMLDHPNIRVEPCVDFEDLSPERKRGTIVYSGPLDAYFGCRLGRLPYRSLHFEHEHLARMEWFQPAAVVNYPNEHTFTRITEFKHITGQAHPATSIVREYPGPEGDPYYPVYTPESKALAARYLEAASCEGNVLFIGRLGRFAYLNMDQIVAVALEAAAKLL
jgi:UDP-galactopyranose mutase